MPNFPSLDNQPGFSERLFAMDMTDVRIRRLCEVAEGFMRAVLHNARDNGTHLVLCGSVGAGKTRVAKTIWRQIQAWAVQAQFTSGWNGKHPGSVWADWPELCDLDKDAAFQDRLLDIAGSEVVFLDDVGSEADKFKGGEAASRLRRILSCIESNWLLLTTNLSKTAFLEQYDYRVADRLSAAHWYELHDVPSYRPRLRKFCS